MSLHKLDNSGSMVTSIRNKLVPFFFAAQFALAILFSADAAGQGNLLITPRRVVFEGIKRSFDLNLSNIGKDTATYSISLVQIKMKDDGNFEQISEPDPGQKFADRYIRFFPRSVTLGPGESQVIKVQLIRTGDLQPGEYRSHFYFRAVPKASPLGEKEKIDTTAISIRLTPVFGITIPAIIRVGESNMKVTLSSLLLESPAGSDPILKMAFNRTGNMSVYGDLTVDYISPEGKTTRVAMANGVAVYTPNTIRHFQLSLSRVQGIDYKTGILRVSYNSPSDVKPVKYAETELQLH